MSQKRQQARVAYLMLTPVLAAMVVFYLIPIAGGFYLALTDFRPYAGTADFVGLDNFRVMVNDHLFFITLRNTAVFTILFVPLTVICGLGAALAIEKPFRGVGIVRLSFFLPTLASGVVVSYFVALVLAPNVGWLNVGLNSLGLPQIGWMADPNRAMLVLVGTAVWKTFGWAMIIYLAGLAAIPDEVYEAARIDGAGRLKMLRFIVLPLLRRVTLTVVVLTSIMSLQVFDMVNVLAGSWLPLESVTTLMHQIYLNAFQFNNAGYASAIAVVLFVLIAAVSFFNFRVLRKDID